MSSYSSSAEWFATLLDRDDVCLLSVSPAARQRFTIRDCIARGAVRCLNFMAEHWGCAPEDWPRVVAGAFGLPHQSFASGCAAAAAAGHLPMLKLLRERECEWDEDTCTRAAANGHLDCLQFALDMGCPCDIEASMVAAAESRCRDVDCLRLLLDRFPDGCTVAAQPSIAAAAAAVGRLTCLQLLHARGWAWDGTACAAAALGGFPCCLDLLLSNNCPCDELAAEHAAMAGAISCLVLAVERGAPIGLGAAEAAARNGNDDCLQYLLFRMSEEMGRRCSGPCAIAAAEGGSVECLALLLKHAGGAADCWNWELMERRASPRSDAKAWIAAARAAAAAEPKTAGGMIYEGSDSEPEVVVVMNENDCCC